MFFPQTKLKRFQLGRRIIVIGLFAILIKELHCTFGIVERPDSDLVPCPGTGHYLQRRYSGTLPGHGY